MKRLLFESGRGNLLVELTADAVSAMTTYAADAGPHETGGILVGRYVDDFRIQIDIVLGPPPDSRRGRDWFERGTEGLRATLRALWEGPERRYYVGEWHFHPAFDGKPSPQDVRQMEAFAKQPRLHCTEPLMVIVSFDANHGWGVRAFHFARTNGMEQLLRLLASA